MKEDTWIYNDEDLIILAKKIGLKTKVVKIGGKKKDEPKFKCPRVARC